MAFLFDWWQFVRFEATCSLIWRAEKKRPGEDRQVASGMVSDRFGKIAGKKHAVISDHSQLVRFRAPQKQQAALPSVFSFSPLRLIYFNIRLLKIQYIYNL